MNNEEKQTELVVIEVLQPELLTVAETSGMALTEAQEIGVKFAPYMTIVNDLSAKIQELKGKEITPEIASLARKYRLELVSNRGKKGLLETEEELKRSLLIRTKIIQNYKGVVIGSSELAENDAEAIEKHSERLETERLNKLYTERVAKLEPYGEVNKFIDLRSMDEVTFSNFLSDTKLAYETRRENEIKLEQEHIESERKAEEERLLAAKKAEEARIKKEAEDKAERERIEKENAELKKQQEQREEAEKQRIAKELVKVEKFAKMLVAAGFELHNNDSYTPQDQHRWCKDEYSVSFGQLTLIESGEELKELIDATNNRISERKRLEKDQADKDSEIAKLKAEQEAEKSRIAAEEQEKLAKEKAELLAPEIDKVKSFFEKFEELRKSFPELTSEEGISLAKSVNESMMLVRGIIINESKKLL